jgi:hypothetical protein
MSTFVSTDRKQTVPETRTGEEGSAKRNIVRKKNVGGSGHRGGKKTHSIDDGSLYKDPAALDEHDPNFDSEEETGREYIPGSSPGRFDYNPELRTSVTLAKMTLPEYKKRIEDIIEV